MYEVEETRLFFYLRIRWQQNKQLFKIIVTGIKNYRSKQRNKGTQKPKRYYEKRKPWVKEGEKH